MSKRWTLIGVATLILLVLTALVAISTFLPAVAAYGCPSCYGFRSIGKSVYLEENTTESEQKEFSRMLREAEVRLLTFYETRQVAAPVFWSVAHLNATVV
ncbi:MAG: hypothetical protein MPJ78_11750 [Hyphomicrobiaceae bacterium]|nr:hypothetical protein [Hyphomicrobiaceae bacterium]